MPRCVLSGILGEILADLNDLYREKCDESLLPSDAERSKEFEFEKMLQEMGMKKWGPINGFEELAIDLVDRYEKKI